MMRGMQAADFVAKWRASQHKESAAYVSHFEDLCRLVGHQTPIEADPSGGFFCYQKGVTKESGKQGFADVWYRNRFGWEYKSKGGDLGKAFDQLLQYRDNLENPPLLIVSDFDTIVVRTNFNGTVSQTYTITLDDIASGEPLAGTTLNARQVLSACFDDPNQLKPGQTPEGLTKAAADDFSRIAAALRAAVSARYDPVTRSYPREYTDDQIARFLSKLLFCMFASDVGLLPKGIVGNLIDRNRNTASQLAARFKALFEVMNTGGPYGADEIPHFNGGLFRDSEALEIPSGQVDALRDAEGLDWTDVEPSIFGTLFERILDPAKRSQLGKHYTSRDDIETIVRPVVMEPLEREWAAIQEEVGPLLRWETQTGERRKASRDTLVSRLQSFLDHLGQLRILDPACGSGNFLYVTMDLLKTLERRVIAFGATHAVAVQPRVHPRQLFGIELNEYAHELASIVVWIGYLQWKRRNGFSMVDEDPILQPLDNISQMDAILSRTPEGRPYEPAWPEADFIVGNPPFLGGKKLRNEKFGLGDAYVDALFEVWDGRVRREADLCCYWHEKAREMVATKKARRVGLLATQAIRGGANRDTLARMKRSGGIFFAESDRPWVLDGAAVRVSMVGFDDGSETRLRLDGRQVEGINADLTSSSDLTQARRLKENLGISFMGDTKVGPFEIDSATATMMLAAPNPHGKPNSDVVRPWVNGLDITRRPRGMWIIDFPPGTSEEEAALYEKPFEYVVMRVLPERRENARKVYAERWWIHGEARPSMRASLAEGSRFLATPSVAKHRVFVWLQKDTLPDHKLFVFGRDDDYFFGVLQSRVHGEWALAKGSIHGDGSTGGRPVYNNTTCFETFPFPRPTPGQVAAIGSAAADLNQLRENWLNPPGLSEEDLKKRTLTNLYNERPTWLANAHRKLDQAVFAAYGWPADLDDAEVLSRLLALNLEREGVAGSRMGV
jgi:type II restriction/modification system DNA methylase subunit YeeA